MANEVDSLEIKIEASASQANKQMDLLIAKLQNVSKCLNGINTSKISGIGTGTKTSNITKLGDSFKGLDSSIRSTNKSTHSLAYSFGKFYANCFLLIRGVKALGKAIGNSMDYVETFNYFSVTMDKIGKEFSNQYENYGYDSAESYADSFQDRMNSLTTKMTGYNVGEKGELTQVGIKNLSLDPQKIMDYQASISAVTNSLGLAGETSVNTSKALSMLAADMSSFKNVDLSTVMTNFQSGLIGQSRALYKYGIDITNATLQTYAYKYGLNTAVSEMTQADKMQLRLLAILDQSKVAWGDQANTINSVANQYRIFKQQISNLARIIGNLFLPIVQKVLPVVNALVIAMQRLFSALGVSLFGKSWLTEIMDGISSGYSASDDTLGDLEESADDTADALDNANKAAKELKTTTLGIDELNINSPQTDSSSSGSSSGSGTGGGVDLSDAIADALADYESVWDKALADSENKASEMADRIVDAFKRHDYEGIGDYIGTGLTNALNKIPWESIYTVASNFGSGFAEFLNGLISPELFGTVGKTIASSLNTAIYTWLSFSKDFDWTNFGNSIASGVNTFFETFDFKALAKSINTWVQGLFTALTTAISEIKWKDVFKGIGDFLGELDLSTVSILIGGFSLKYTGKTLAKVIPKKIATILSTAVGSKVAYAGTEFIIPIAAVIAVSIASITFGKKSIEKDKNKLKKAYEDSGLLGYLKESVKQLANPFEWINEIGGGAIENLSKDKNIIDIRNMKESELPVVFSLKTKKEDIQEWWEDTKSFWGEKNLAIKSSFEDFKEKVKIKWDEVLTYWKTKDVLETIKTTYESFKTNVKEKWDKVLTYWSSKTNLSKVITTYQNFKDKIKEKWEIARTWWRDSKESLKEIDISIPDILGKIQEKWNNLKGWWDKNVHLSIPQLDFHVDYKNKGLNVAQKAIVKALNLDGWPSLKFYADGGMPNTGELFMARENGITEMVGSMGSHSAVANNDQIVEGITRGVESAVSSVLAPYLQQIAQNTKETANKDMSVNIGDKQIARANIRGQRSMGLQVRTT